MGTLKAYIGPCRPPYGPLRALIGGPQEGPGPCMGCPIPPILWSLKWTRADLRGPFLIGSLVPRPQKVQKGSF